ncbi:hypothetical protein HAX54_036654 [Datura stramonium]|uniref:AP2/ERF domain-containing protein n=1 Tax=Datura stramonium TaxID=4076 RepID=A0ABS8VKH4_DATST|nr:hypothetical protein [Datura stramonium]
MASSMNNWLGFSLLPHEEVLTSQQSSHQECFDLMTSHHHHDESTVVLPSLNVVPHHDDNTPFGIFEAFNRNHRQSSQDWNTHDSMLMGNACNSQHLETNQEPPKLENFLGIGEQKLQQVCSNSSNNNNNNNNVGDYNNIYCSASNNNISENNANNIIGLSMIKNWLRNNPTTTPTITTTSTAPLSQDDKKEGDVAVVAGCGGGSNAQSLSLSMSTGGGGGGYDKEEKAARAYDLAALKYWGPTTTTNFPISNYEKELEEMKHMTRQEYVASLRREEGEEETLHDDGDDVNVDSENGDFGTRKGEGKIWISRNQDKYEFSAFEFTLKKTVPVLPFQSAGSGEQNVFNTSSSHISSASGSGGRCAFATFDTSMSSTVSSGSTRDIGSITKSWGNCSNFQTKGF